MEKQSYNTNTSSSWIRGSCIGRGCFGTVSKAMSKSDGGVFAVKSVDLSTCLSVQSDSIENEIVILRSLKSHPHIVRFIGDDLTKEGTTTFRNLHLEYLPEGDVADSGLIEESLLRRYLRCLVSALSHVHSNGIVHCDVKSKNVLVFNGGRSVKLADFGSAIGFEKQTVKITPRGSPLWMAPEVIRTEYQGPESDVWSLGCTVIEMLTGKPAWEDQGFDTLSRIGFSNELPCFPAGLSELGCDFLEKCLRRDWSQRWSCDQLLQHPFLCQDDQQYFTESSPRCVLDWVNSEFEEEEEESDGSRFVSTVSAMARISKLATTGGAIWESNGWIEVRGNATSEELLLTNMEYSVSTRTLLELNISPDSSGDDSVKPSENEESATEMTCEILSLLLLLLVVEKIQIYATFYTSAIINRILYCCCCYHRHTNINDKKKFRNLFFYSQPFTFILVWYLHVIRINLPISRKLLRGVDRNQDHVISIIRPNKVNVVVLYVGVYKVVRSIVDMYFDKMEDDDEVVGNVGLTQLEKFSNL